MTRKRPFTSESAGCRSSHDSPERGICQVNGMQLLFDAEDVVVPRPRVNVPAPVVAAREDDPRRCRWRRRRGSLDVADLGRIAKAAAVNRTLLRRAWAGAAPSGPIVRSTRTPRGWRPTGQASRGSAFARGGQTGLSPLVGVCGKTGDGPLHRRVRRGDPGRRPGRQAAVDSRGLGATSTRSSPPPAMPAWLTVTARQPANGRAAIYVPATRTPDGDPPPVPSRIWAVTSPRPPSSSPA
jgi:hypothetical protein